MFIVQKRHALAQSLAGGVTGDLTTSGWREENVHGAGALRCHICPMGSGFDAFISYRHGDGAAAQGVAKLLRAFSQRVFIDVDIAAGDEWAPEIWEALAQARVLIVLWSRSAAKSAFVRREWSRAPKGSTVFALKLDGEPLPDDLGEFNAITGLDVAGRLLARSVELMQAGKLSPSRAQQQLLAELEQDGVVLEPKQKQALAAFLPLVTTTSIWGPAPWTAVGAVAAPALLVAGTAYLIVTRVDNSRLQPESSPKAAPESSIHANLPGVTQPAAVAAVSACPTVAPIVAPAPQQPVSNSCATERTALERCSAQSSSCADEYSSCKEELKQSRSVLGETKSMLLECERATAGLKAAKQTAVECTAKLEQCVAVLKRRTKPALNAGDPVKPNATGAVLKPIPQVANPEMIVPDFAVSPSAASVDVLE